MEGVGVTSLDSKKSQTVKQEKLREEAQYEKERGNVFVKQEKWDEAIACYNRAIELVQDDAIYYANRGLCYLKKDSLHQAERDCTEALRLDPTYVKAFQRRATASERLGSLRAAANDLTQVLAIEPHNKAARRQLEDIRARMGTKGAKSKSSPSSTPTTENKTMTKNIIQETKPQVQVDTAEDKWRDGAGENITVIKPVKKPPHLRSKRPLKPVQIQEILLGKTTVEKPPTRLKIEEIETIDSNKTESIVSGQGDVSPESIKLVHESLGNEKNVNVKSLPPPVNSVQFMAQWKELQGNDEARSDYLSIIDPVKIPTIFANALESFVLSDVINLVRKHTGKFPRVSLYLRGFCQVKRFSALAMFLTAQDKQYLANLLEHCKTTEQCGEDVIADLKNKYEL